jgi:aminopeptidase N
MRNTLFAISMLFGLFANAQRPFDILHYQFKLNLSDSSNRIVGKASIDFKAIETINHLELNLGKYDKNGKGMQVTYVGRYGDRQGNQPARLSFQWLSDDRIRIDLGRPVQKDDETGIWIEYNGIPRDGLIISKNMHGDRTFFADNWPDRARQWIPCVDDPADKASVEFVVTAPKQYRVVSNGVQNGNPNNVSTDGMTTSHWVEKVPVPTKVMVIGVARFEVDTVGFFMNTLPVTSWVFPQDTASGFKTYAQAMPILEWMRNYIGYYAYSKLANVQSKTIFGGMENASAIFYYEESVYSEQEEEALIAHEIAHQWFGNMATEKSFHHLWLSEGFATYMTHCYLESKYGDSILKARLQSDREKINEFLSRAPRSVIDSTANYMSLLNANSYEKGSWVLHMIRRQVGNELFQKIIRTYYEQYRGRNADTDDFRRIVESLTGQDWSAFFNQWLRHKANPSLQINWSNSEDGKWITLNIKQLQAGDPFTFPLPIDIINTKGEKKRIELAISKATQPFVLASNGTVSGLIVDPDTNLLIDKLIIAELEK